MQLLEWVRLETEYTKVQILEAIHMKSEDQEQELHTIRKKYKHRFHYVSYDFATSEIITHLPSFNQIRTIKTGRKKKCAKRITLHQQLLNRSLIET